MKKLLFIISVILSTGILSAQNLKLDQLLEKNFKAIGQDKLANVQTIKLTGKMLQGNMEISMISMEKRPNLRRFEGELQGTKFIQSFDGQNGWTINPMSGSLEPQDMAPETLKTFKEENDESYGTWDNPFFTWERLGSKIELVGKEDLNGIAVYNIKITAKDNTVDNYYMDASTFLVLRVKSRELKQDVMAETETVYSDFKMIDGIMCALKIELIDNGQTSVVIKIDNYEFNTPIEDSLFKKPVTIVK